MEGHQFLGFISATPIAFSLYGNANLALVKSLGQSYITLNRLSGGVMPFHSRREQSIMQH